MQLAEYERYNKISDEMYRLNWNTSLNFIVILSKQTKDKRRWNMHHEYEYADKKFTNTNNLITIKRTFDYYLSIESQLMSNNTNSKYFIQIRVENILLIRSGFKRIIDELLNTKETFIEVDNQLKVRGDKGIEVNIPGLPQGQWLIAKVIVMDDKGYSSPGVRLYLGSTNVFVDMNTDKFMGLYYLLSTINMYESAQLLINYLQRPSLGYNKKSFMDEPDIDSIVDDGIEATEGPRRLIPKKKQSAFDKMSDLEK